MTDYMRNLQLDEWRKNGFKDLYIFQLESILLNWNLKDDMRKAIEKAIKEKEKENNEPIKKTS